MVALELVLGNLARVLANVLGQKVGGVSFLQQQVAFVFLVGQDREDRAGRPSGLTLHGSQPSSGELLAGVADGVSIDEQLVG